MAKKNAESTDDAAGRYAYEGLDRALHEKARLGIMTSLITRPTGVMFGELKQLCSLTDGNLNRHLSVLVEAGLVEMWKGTENNRPKTLCRVTRAGRERFAAYLAELEKVIRDAAPAKVPSAKKGSREGAGKLGLAT